MNEIEVIAMYERWMEKPQKTRAIWPSFYNTLPRIKKAYRTAGRTKKQASRVIRKIAVGRLDMAQAMNLLFGIEGCSV